MKKKYILTFIIFIIVIITAYYFNFINITKEKTKNNTTPDETSFNTNIIENVNYVSKDASGNEYIINALKGEIDYKNDSIIYLTDVRAVVKLTNSKEVKIKSDFGKYNSLNFDTIFSKNVNVDYLTNNIKGEYLDFSINRNSMIISRNVIYTNLKNILKADVVEINIKTKDTKIFMYDKKEKVNIKSKKDNGSY